MQNTSLLDKTATPIVKGWLSNFLIGRAKSQRGKNCQSFSAKQTHQFLVTLWGWVTNCAFLTTVLSFGSNFPRDSSKMLIIKSGSWWWSTLSSLLEPSKVFPWEAPPHQMSSVTRRPRRHTRLEKSASLRHLRLNVQHSFQKHFYAVKWHMAAAWSRTGWCPCEHELLCPLWGVWCPRLPSGRLQCQSVG